MASILVVDDEPDIRELIQMTLERDGHRVVTAVDGAQALRTLERELPDLVLLDLAMPEIDGWGVLLSMKGSDGPVSRIPVVVLTAHDSVDNRIRGGIEGAIRSLPKPFRLEELLGEINAALAGGPEPAQRRRAQAAALEQLARRERGGRDDDAGPAPVRPHLTRLEHRPSPQVPEEEVDELGERLAGLTPKQRRMIDQLQRSSSVSAAAEELGLSRSNIYASLRRVARRLELASVSEVVAMAKAGRLGDPPSA